MKFSIIMPFKDTQEELLRRSVNSLINQDYSDYEVILVNDGSKGDYHELINEFKNSASNRNLKFIYLVNSKNESILQSRFNGLKVASGEYILHCDSDDYFDLDALIRYDRIISTHPCDAYYNRIKGGDYRYNPYPTMMAGSEITPEEARIMILNGHMLGYLHAKVVCRSAYNKLLPNHKDYGYVNLGEDQILSLELTKHIDSMMIIDDPTYNYMEHTCTAFKRDDIFQIPEWYEKNRDLFRYFEEVAKDESLSEYLRTRTIILFLICHRHRVDYDEKFFNDLREHVPESALHLFSEHNNNVMEGWLK